MPTRWPSFVPAVLAALALPFSLLPGLLGPYGPFIDELYYVSCAERLAWGYVDHPPLAPFLLRLSRAVLGDGLLALRLPAALAGAAVVFLSGRLAGRLGAGRLRQGVACVALLAAPGLQVIFEEVELAGIHHCDLCMPWRDQTPIWIARRARRPISERWAEWKHYE